MSTGVNLTFYAGFSGILQYDSKQVVDGFSNDSDRPLKDV